MYKILFFCLNHIRYDLNQPKYFHPKTQQNPQFIPVFMHFL